MFITAGVSLMMWAIDGTVVAVAFPKLMKDLGSDVIWAGWTISIYSVAVTIIMPLSGNLSDTFGRKRILLVSLIMFTVSSLLCGLAPNIYALVILRFFQGVGGASFLPTAAGIANDLFPESREKLIGFISSIFAIGNVIGPNLGGWIVSRYSWRYIFYINLPIGIGLILLTLILFRDRTESVRPSIDFRGASFFGGAVLFLMLALNLVGERLSALSLVSAAVLLSLAFYLLLLFFRQEKKAPNPIVDVALLRSRPFFAANLYNLFFGIGVLAVFAFVPFYAISVHKVSTLVSGMILTPRSLVIIPASAITSFLLRRCGYRWPMVLGLSIVCISTILLGHELLISRTIGLSMGTAQMIAVLVMISGIGAGIANPASNNACIELMPERVATITGLRGTFKGLGQVLGTSLITLILHFSANPGNGFKIIFLIFGLGLFLSIPLVFMMPTGKKRWAEGVHSWSGAAT
jgi:EmrB/QacA subfamily drug resistance transporter